MKKYVIIGLLVIAAGGGGWYYYKRSIKAAELPPVTAVVERGLIRAVVESTGKVASNLDVDIKCKASGEIIGLPKDVSDEVREGDKLLILDPKDEKNDVKLAESSLRSSQARLTTAQQNLEIAKENLKTSRTRAEATLNSAKAHAQDAAAKSQRMEQLLAKQLVSQEDCDTARTAEAQCQADLQNAQAAVADLNTQKMSLKLREQDIILAEAQVLSDGVALVNANQRLADTVVIAHKLSEVGSPDDPSSSSPAVQTAEPATTQPADGNSTAALLASKGSDPAQPTSPWPALSAAAAAATQPGTQAAEKPIVARVSARPVQIGMIIASGITNVGGGTTIMTLSDLSQMFVYASVDESDIGRVTLGQNVIIDADAFPGRKFKGRIVRIATRGVNVSNVVTFEVKIELTDEKKTLLRPEMTANVHIVVNESRDALIVPWDAVTRKQGKSSITIIKPDGTHEERPVEVGINDGTRYEITSGLKEGETVLVRKNDADSKWKNDPNAARRNQMMMPGGGGGGGGGRRG